MKALHTTVFLFLAILPCQGETKHIISDKDADRYAQLALGGFGEWRLMKMTSPSSQRMRRIDTLFRFQRPTPVASPTLEFPQALRCGQSLIGRVTMTPL